MVEKANFHELSPDRHTCAMACTLIRAYTITKYNVIDLSCKYVKCIKTVTDHPEDTMVFNFQILISPRNNYKSLTLPSISLRLGQDSYDILPNV